MGKKSMKDILDRIPSFNHPQWDHGKPTNRRDAISRGFMLGGGMVIVPSLFSMLAQKAYGIDPALCSGAASADYIASMSFHFAGGECFANHFLVGGPGGQTDFLDNAAASTIGIPGNKNGAAFVDTSMGIATHTESSLVAGIKVYADELTLANMNGLIIPNVSRDDNRNVNWGNISHLLMKGGKAVPQEIAKIAGTGTGSDGGRYTTSGDALTTTTPVQVQSANDAAGLVTPGLIGQILSDNGQLDKLIKAMQMTSVSQLAQLPLNEQQRILVECGYIKTGENLSNFTAQSVDATQDPVFTAINALPNNDPVFNNRDDGDDERAQAIMKLALDGYATHGVVEIGGHDNHGQQVANQRAKAFNTGTLIGQYFRAAKEKGVAAVAFLCTDGAKGAGNNANPDDSSAQSGGFVRTSADNGARSSVVMLAYNPAARPETSTNQIGSFSKTVGAVDTASSPLANNVDLAAAQLVNEFRALSGQGPIVETGVPQSFKKLT